MKRFSKQVIAVVAAFIFCLEGLGLPAAFGQSQLPTVSSLVQLTPAFNPAMLRGLRVDLQNPFHFDFILDNGQ